MNHSQILTVLRRTMQLPVAFALLSLVGVSCNTTHLYSGERLPPEQAALITSENLRRVAVMSVDGKNWGLPQIEVEPGRHKIVFAIYTGYPDLKLAGGNYPDIFPFTYFESDLTAQAGRVYLITCPYRYDEDANRIYRVHPNAHPEIKEAGNYTKENQLGKK